MKMTGIHTYTLRAMLGEKGFGWSQRVTGTRQAAICVISTDAGVQGVGEAFYFGGPSTILAQLVTDGIGPLFIRKDLRTPR